MACKPYSGWLKQMNRQADRLMKTLVGLTKRTNKRYKNGQYKQIRGQTYYD